MANDFYNRGASFNPDELADGDAIEAEFDAVARGFDTIEDLVDLNKAGYPSQTFHVAPATKTTHAVQKAQLDSGLAPKLNAANYNAADVLSKLKTVDGTNSGLDADLLDGQEGSYYRNASNINNGTIAKERLPASIDASTSGNAATASKVSGTAIDGGTADLVSGAMAGSDFFRIRVGGSADAGWTEIATADGGNEPIYVRQYNLGFGSVTKELKLLDANGDTHLPGNLRAAVGGVTVKDTNCGMYPGNGDSASSTINNLKLSSWFGIGFGPSISGQPVPLGEYSHWFNVRNGDMGVRGTITAPQLNGNASTATRLATTRQINGVNFDGTANITVADDTKLPLTGGDLSGPITFTPGSGNVLNFGATPVIRRFTGANSMSMGVGGDDTLLLGAGESVGIMATNLTLGGEGVHIGAETNIFMHVSSDNWATWAGKKTFSIDATNGPLWNGGKVWNAGNDGAGSGLDADLLDGQDGSYYRNASNINAGTIGDAYLPATISSSITGNASTASALQTARTINNISFNGSANITVEPYVELDTGTAATRYLTFVDSSTAGYQRMNMDTALTYNPSTNILSAAISGNAASATILQNTRTINGVSFNGSANVTVEPYVELDTGTAATRYITFVDSSTAGYQRHNIDTALTYNPSTNVLGATISGNAGTATKLATARTITLGGDLSGSASFDGSANITITGSVNNISVLHGTIAHGGTIPLPSGFTEAQCKWLVSMNNDNPSGRGWDIQEGGAHVHYSQQVYTTGRVVTAQTYLGSNNVPPGWISSTANYIIIGVK